MTESEAKKYMLIEKECINRDCNRDCANCDIVQDVEDLNNAYDVAINALEKQIPKKPIIKLINFCHAYHCPVCNGYICSTAIRKEVILEENIFCGVCGQKFDWSDEE